MLTYIKAQERARPPRQFACSHISRRDSKHFLSLSHFLKTLKNCLGEKELVYMRCEFFKKVRNNLFPTEYINEYIAGQSTLR